MITAKRLHEVAQAIFTVDVAIMHDNSLLMFKRSPSKKVFPGWLALPGGHIEEGEDPFTAAIREIREEVGITIHPDDVQLKYVAMHHHRDHGHMYVVFGFLTHLTKKPKRITLSNEGEPIWIEKNQALTMEEVLPPVKYYFDHVLHNKPGIIYNNSIWENCQLVHVSSETLDKNS